MTSTPEKKLMPTDPRAKAEARVIDELVATSYEAINWAWSEIVWSERAIGELKENLKRQIQNEMAKICSWLSDSLGDKEYFSGNAFGFADVCVAPVLNRSVQYGFGPAGGTTLRNWHAKISQRNSVRLTFAEMEEGAKKMQSMSKKMFNDEGAPYGMEYRDHRLEWMIKSGGIEIVLEDLKRNNIGFGWPFASRREVE
ncbi:hypothetical protein M433DRAFT_20615 [Acidomyces richmondensis BFW]|nr:MAG: hypothetical protein FE78DRAFT_453384 [Acidomyces sp. 'richmondensis']KYG50464.1 hypothetical protein M433DRAFT_20615 [Acidomyces richmondensis BFW]